MLPSPVLSLVAAIPSGLLQLGVCVSRVTWLVRVRDTRRRSARSRSDSRQRGFSASQYLREQPTRAAVMALIAAQHEREETPGRKTSVLESGRTEIGGREVDIGWLMPQNPAAGTIEDIAAAVGGTDSDRVNWRPLAGMLSPQYRSSLNAVGGFGQPTEQLGRAFVPGFSTVERIGRGGGTGEQVLRGLGSTIDYIEPGKKINELQAERKAVLPALKGKVDAEDEKWIRRAYDIAGRMESIRAKAKQDTGDGEPYYRAVLEAEARYMGTIGVFDSDDVKWLVGIAKNGTYDEVRKRRDSLIQGPYEGVYLKAKRNGKKIVGYAP